MHCLWCYRTDRQVSRMGACDAGERFTVVITVHYQRTVAGECCHGSPLHHDRRLWGAAPSCAIISTNPWGRWGFWWWTGPHQRRKYRGTTDTAAQVAWTTGLRGDVSRVVEDTWPRPCTLTDALSGYRRILYQWIQRHFESGWLAHGQQHILLHNQKI